MIATYNSVKLEAVNIEREIFRMSNKIIGYSQGKTIEEYITLIFGIPLDYIPFYERSYWINKLKLAFKNIETQSNLLFLHRNKVIYIPDSEEDIRYYTELIKKAKISMDKRVKKITQFVNNKEFERLKILNVLESN